MPPPPYFYRLATCWYSEDFHLLATFLFRGKILTGGYVLKIISKDPILIKTTYITHIDLQGILLNTEC